jgi:hypothetical protein
MKKSYLFLLVLILSVMIISCNAGLNDSPVMPEIKKEVKPNIFGKTDGTKSNNVQNSGVRDSYFGGECGDTTRPY